MHFRWDEQTGLYTWGLPHKLPRKETFEVDPKSAVPRGYPTDAAHLHTSTKNVED